MKSASASPMGNHSPICRDVEITSIVVEFLVLIVQAYLNIYQILKVDLNTELYDSCLDFDVFFQLLGRCKGQQVPISEQGLPSLLIDNLTAVQQLK